MSTIPNPPPASYIEPAPLSRLPRPGAENPPWTGGDVALIALVIFLSIVVFTMVGITFIMASTSVTTHDALAFLKDFKLIVAAQTSAYVAGIVWMVALVRRRSHLPFWREVRWNWPGLGRACGYAAAGMALAMAVDVATAFLPMPKTLPVDELFRTARAAYTMAIFGIVIAPFLEEIFFRGFLYPVLARRLGVALGIALTAAAFALIHQQQLAHSWLPLLMLFLVALVFTSTRAQTRSVACAWMMHVGYNTALFALAFIATEGFRHMEKLVH